MKKRIISELRKIILIIFAGVLYYFFVLLTGFSIPCLFNKVTGFLCPACGISRMIMAAVRFDFAAAYSFNKCLFLMAPFLLITFLYSEILYIKYNKRTNSLLNIILWAEIVALIVFGIVRNII